MTLDNPHNQPDSHEPQHSEPIPPTAPKAPPPRKRRWLRRTLIGVGIVVLVLVILLILAPTIASMGWARSIAVNKINQNLNGHVQIANWSLGWTSGIKVDGIKVFDDQNRQVLEIPHVSTQLSLLNAARGNYALGQTVVDSPDFNIVRYPDGTTNLQKLKKAGAPATTSAPSDQSSSSASAAKPAPVSKNEKTQREQPTKLPNVSGELKLVNGRGTVETITLDSKTNQEQHDMVKFTSIQGDVKIPNINQSISDSIQIVEVPGNSSQSGTLSINGQLLVAKNNQLLDATQMSGNQDVTLSAVELSGFAPFAPPTITALAGSTNGKITLNLTPGQGDVLEGKITSANFKLGGPILSGDTYAATSAVIDIPRTTLTGDPNDYHIKVGDGKQQAITLTLSNSLQGQQPSQSTMKLVVDAGTKALQNLGAHQKPGSNGLVHADLDFDLVPLAQMLPHMLHMLEDVRLTSGRLANTLDVQLTPDRANLSQSLSIANVAGTHADGKPIKLDPINQSFKAADLGGGGKIPDLRDMVLVLTTSSDPSAGWASANIAAPSIGQVKGQIHAALDRAQQQLGQIIDFGSTKLGGALDVALTSNGDLIGNESNPNQTLTSDITANTTLQNLSIDGMAGKQPIHEPFIGLNTNVTLVRGKEMFVQSLRNFATKLIAGDQQHPSVDATLGGNIDFSQHPSTDPANKGENETVPSTKDMKYAVKIDLPRLQNELGAFLSLLSDSQLTIQNGQATAGGSIVYDGQSTSLPDVALNATGIDLVKGNSASARKVLSGYNLTLRTAMSESTSPDGSTTRTIPNLTISDNAGLLRMESTGGPIRIVKSSDGRTQASAKLHISNTELAQLQNVMRAFGKEVTAQTPEGAVVRGGILTGTLDVASAADNQIQVTSNLDANGITITAPNTQGLSNEKLTVALQVRAADDFSSANVDKVDANASFLNAHIGDTVLVLKEGKGANAKSVSTVDMLRKANVKVDVPDLAKLMAVKEAFVPSTPAPQSASGQPGAPPTEPTTVTRGTATFTLNVTRDKDQLSILPNVAVRGLVLHNSDGDEPIGSVDLNAKQLALLINPAPSSTPPTTQPSVMDQVREVQIGQLVASVTGAQLTVNGSILDPGKTRRFQNMGADLTYDASKLWTIIYPMLSKKSQQDFKDAKVAGSYTKHISIDGSYPNVDPTKDPNAKTPIESLFATGDFTVDQFDGAGASLAKLDIPFVINKGYFVISIVGKPAGQDMPQPATLNGGKLDLGGIFADLKDPHLRLTAPNAKKLLDNVSLNPAFARLFGDWINNPMFVTADNAAGQLDITINQCTAFPLDKSVMDRSPSNTGVMDLSMVLNRVQLGNQMMSNISQQMQGILGNGIALQSLQGDIPKLHVHIEHGITKEEMTMTFGEGKRPLNLTGDVVMDSRQMNMVLDLPADLLGVGKNNQQLSFLNSNGIQIPLNGTVDRPEFDAGKAVQANFSKAPQDLIKGLLNNKGDNKNQDQPTSKPSKEKDNNPLDQLQDLLNRNKKK